MGFRRFAWQLTVFCCALLPASGWASAKDVAKRVLASTVFITAFDGAGQPLKLGSGFVSADGFVVTNNHVIRDARVLTVRLIGSSDEVRVESVAWSEASVDLAVLKLPLKAPPLSTRNSAVVVGEEVYAAGNPKGLEGTFSNGIVSSIRLEGQLIQLTAPISPGSSGGPIVDSSGAVVGVAVATYRDGQNLNFAIPIGFVPQEFVTAPKGKTGRSSLALPRADAPQLLDAPLSPVEAYNFRWKEDPKKQCFANADFDFSLRNRSEFVVSRVRILVLFFDERGESIHSELVAYPSGGALLAGGERSAIQPNAPKFTLGLGSLATAPCEVAKLSSRAELRVLSVEVAAK